MISAPDAIISFPMFGENFAFAPPMTFTIFGLTIFWYGVIIAIGFFLALIYVSRRCKEFGLTSDTLTDVLIYAVPTAIIGSRLYYVAFNFSIFRDNPAEILRIWHGGLAIYGAIIGAVIATFIFSHIKKIPVGTFLDMGAFGFLIGQIVGRWGNFFNREAFGIETDTFFRMGLTDRLGNTIYVHPAFLYESMWNLLGFILLHIFSKKYGRKYDGQIFLIYTAWYGFGRMLIEGIRADSLFIGSTNLRASQLLAGAAFITSLAILIFNLFRPHDESKLYVNAKELKAAPAAENDANPDEAE